MKFMTGSPDLVEVFKMSSASSSVLGDGVVKLATQTLPGANTQSGGQLYLNFLDFALGSHLF